MIKFLKWLIFPQHTINEVFIVLVVALIGSTYTHFWPNMLSRGIVIFVLLAGVVSVGRFIFLKGHLPDGLTRKSIQFIGMVLILVIMIQNMDWLKIRNQQHGVIDIGSILLSIYGLLIVVRASVGVLASGFVMMGGRLRIQSLVAVGLIYFTNIPDVRLSRSRKVIGIITTFVAVAVYYYTRSVVQAFIFGSLSLDGMEGIQQLSLIRTNRRIKKYS